MRVSIGLSALLLLSCASSAGTDSSGQGALAIDTPSAVAESVITPFGKMKRACVHAVESASTAVDESAADPSCLTTAPDAVKPATDSEPPGWVSWADEDLVSGVSFLQADFDVPPVPANVGDQVIFIFPSLTPTINPPIIQPVLQFGEAANGGGRYWSISSWYLNKEASSFNSKVVRVNAGDKLRGTIQGTGGCSKGLCKSWTITLADLTQPKLTTTLTTKGGGSHYVQIQGAALETYQMESCAQYPSAPVVFTNIILKSNSGAVITPKWKLFDNATATPQCGFTATSPSPGEIDLAYTSAP